MKKDTNIKIDKKYSIAEVHKLFREWNDKYGTDMNVRHKKKYVETFDGYPVKTWSQRYQLFLLGTMCVKCGLQAVFYRLEKSVGAKFYHFNLYGLRNDEEVLFTKDHIIPVSKGGRSHISNYQVMCCKCNQEKGNKTE